MEFSEYLEFRHTLAKWNTYLDTQWIEDFVEKLYLDYHSAYTQGRLDGMENTLYLLKESIRKGEQ